MFSLSLSLTSEPPTEYLFVRECGKHDEKLVNSQKREKQIFFEKSFVCDDYWVLVTTFCSCANYSLNKNKLYTCYFFSFDSNADFKSPKLTVADPLSLDFCCVSEGDQPVMYRI